jgi:ParB-like chromosome segregation protein Spo0J
VVSDQPELRIFFAGSLPLFGAFNMQTLSIEYQPLSALKLRPSYPRTHSEKQIEQIANAIGRFGFTNPILVGKDNVIVAGVGRHRAAAKVGLSQVPTVGLADMSEAELSCLRHCR